jgi:hypothetical protein
MNLPRPVLPIHRRVAIIILGFLFCSVATRASAQQGKPNVTGTWKLNPRMSVLARQHGHGDDYYKIKHSEPRLEIEHTFSGQSETYAYTVDGKEHRPNKSRLDRLETRARVYWVDDTLVMEKLQETDRGLSIWTSRYALSQDGSRLVVAHHVNKSLFRAAFDESLTYEKQQ